jgi:hypothetical protein
MYIKGFADDRRHGDIVDVPGQDRKEILDVTWTMIMRFIRYLDNQS